MKGQGLRARLFKLAIPLFKAKPAHIDDLLGDGQVLPVLGGLRVINTPGHTPGHISLYTPAVKILFGGDSMLAENNGMRRCSSGVNTRDEDTEKEAVNIQQALGAEIVCSGHGPIVREVARKFPNVQIDLRFGLRAAAGSTGVNHRVLTKSLYKHAQLGSCSRKSVTPPSAPPLRGHGVSVAKGLYAGIRDASLCSA